ncbi:MAG: HAD-IIIC family phosphatase [Myxococcota bacterium]
MGKGKPKELKALVWDLDNTLWKGVLLEKDDLTLRAGIVETLKALDERGILLSIASKNNHGDAMARLKQLGIDHYFLFPQITWSAKSESLASIKEALNIGMDTIAFIDDDDFERAEVQAAHPDLVVINSTDYWSDYTKLLGEPRFSPKYLTEDSRRRRLMYLESAQRDHIEAEYKGPKEEFLQSLEMRFVISRATEADLQRAEELTVRTNQLNSTGVTFSYEELDKLRRSNEHQLLICELTDKFGSYGKIGLALVETGREVWHLRLMLMSCRVMSRGVGTIFLSYIMQQAKEAGARFLADFIQTERNRMMYVSYKFSQFKEVESGENGRIVFENDLTNIQPFPKYVSVVTPSTPREK